MSTVRGVMSNVEARSIKGRLLLGLFLIILILASLIVIFPFFFSFTAGLKSSIEINKPGLNLWPPMPHWENYLDAWRRFNMPQMFWNTIVVAGGGVIAQLLISTLAAFFLSRLKPIGVNLMMALILVTMTVPRIAYIIPLYITIAKFPLFDLNLVNTYWGLWLPYAVNPFMILVLKSAFDGIPKDVYDAAQVDGASNARLFFQFTLPLSTSIMLVLGLLSFITLWGDFLLPLLVLRDPELQTISVRLYNLTRMFPINLHLAGSFIAMLPPLFAAIFLQRYMKGGLTF
ncbi:MAG: carbohydrate ABC transporter permease [Anaerolineaceae bacterium]|nr:carbohydrate ABC transporter permease [Anaerolineaceae bacterium]